MQGKQKRRKGRQKRPVSYHAKDVFSKVMAEAFKGESFSPFGIDLPGIVDAEPTNLPAIEANELRMDNLFRLKDGSFAIIDYESDYSEENKIKYLGYLARVERRLYNEIGEIQKLRLIILYTADVKRGATDPVIDLGCGQISITEGFLSEMDKDAVWSRAEELIERGRELDKSDMMQLMVYPLTYESLQDKQDAIHRLTGLVDRLVDDKQRGFILSGIMVFADKIIREDDAEEIRRKIMLTKVEKIIAREMQDAVDAAVEKNTEEVSSRIAQNFLRSGMSVEVVAENTNIPIESVRKLQEAVM